MFTEYKSFGIIKIIMKNLEHFKELLLQEKAQLESEMASVGQIEPGNPENWQGTQSDIVADIDESDENSVADKLEDLEERNAVETELEDRRAEIMNALTRMNEGKYGICRVCGIEIEEARLEANSAAETCKSHLNG